MSVCKSEISQRGGSVKAADPLFPRLKKNRAHTPKEVLYSPMHMTEYPVSAARWLSSNPSRR